MLLYLQFKLGGVYKVSSPLFVVPFIIRILVFIAILAMAIYSFILFVKLAKRGIKALDIYLKEKEQS